MINKDNEHLINIERGFVEHITKDPHLLYADTDSAYIKMKLPFSKFESQQKVVEYTQKMTMKINNIYLYALNKFCGENGGLVKEYNTMDFKGEIIAYKGFFNTKKFYALSKLWDEGTFFEKPKLKYTGGQYKKADITKITKEMITEIYDICVMDIHQTNIRTIAKTVFVDIKNKYTQKLKTHIKQLDLDYFCIPKKWGFSEKRVPKWVEGAKLYNSIVSDQFRPGDSVSHIQITFNSQKLENYLRENGFTKNIKEYTNINDPVFRKLDSISIPPNISDSEKEKLLEVFEKFDIKPDFDEIIAFNITKKMDVFVKLFDPMILRDYQ